MENQFIEVDRSLDKSIDLNKHESLNKWDKVRNFVLWFFVGYGVGFLIDAIFHIT